MDRTSTRLLAWAVALLCLSLGIWALWPQGRAASGDPGAVTRTARTRSPPEAPQRPWDREPWDRAEATEPAPEAAQVDPDPAAEERLVSQILTEAEHAFGEADLESATELFQRIVDRHPDSPQAPFAAYKLAWCRFNEGDRMEAIRSMELLANWLDTTDVPNGDKLAEAARKDLELFRATDDELPAEAVVEPDGGDEP